jgi:adenylosuccinate synthase
VKARVVIGSSFGDEGKGLTVDYLCAQGAGVVVRFNGGAQAGHTVVTPEGQRHVFRHVGSGSFLGIPTFLSNYFVCNPILFFEEMAQLKALNVIPKVFAHPDCLVTTFMDMIINQEKETKRGDKRHGSCGIGFAETINRSKIDRLKITMGDLWDGGSRIESQLDEICTSYAKFRIGRAFTDTDVIQTYLACVRAFAEAVHPAGIGDCDDPVFEGAQGLLLDQDNKEFFPHLTHSSTGMKNVFELCRLAKIDDIDIHYISRTYTTRHGAGPLPGQDDALSYEDNTNRPNDFQGSMRFAPLDPDSLIARCKADAAGRDFKLVMTHCDQEPSPIEAALYSDGPTRDHVSTDTTKRIIPRAVPV